MKKINTYKNNLRAIGIYLLLACINMMSVWGQKTTNTVGDFTVTGNISNYSFSGSTLTITGDVTVKNTVPATPTTNNIIVEGSSIDSPIDVTIDGLNIKIENTKPVTGISAFEIKDNTAVNLTINDNNKLSSGYDRAGIEVPVNTKLTITDGSNGTLTVISKDNGNRPGIGSKASHSKNGDIIINGGTLIVDGTNSAAGIGGGIDCSAGNITINGGDITINKSGDYGAAIGSGNRASNDSGHIKITGGIIKATKGYIGGGGDWNNSAGTIEITGGTIISERGVGCDKGSGKLTISGKNTLVIAKCICGVTTSYKGGIIIDGVTYKEPIYGDIVSLGDISGIKDKIESDTDGAKLKDDCTLPENMTMTIVDGSTLTTGSYTLTNNGQIKLYASGVIDNKDNIKNNPISNQLTSTMLTTPIPDMPYTGYKIIPDVTLIFNGNNLIKDTDYDVSYNGYTPAENQIVTITGKENYFGTITGTFNIIKATLTDANLTNNAKITGEYGTTWTGLLSELNKKETVVFNGSKLNGTWALSSGNESDKPDCSVTKRSLLFTAGNSYINNLTKDIPVAIDPKAITVDIPVTKVYDGTNVINDDITVDVSSISSDLVNANDITSITIKKDGLSYTSTDADNHITIKGNPTIQITGNHSNYYNITAALTGKITKADLTADDFIFTPPASLNYDGSGKKAEVKASQILSGVGTITVKYTDSNTTTSEELPTESGIYTVSIDVDEGTNYNAASNLTKTEWKFTIIDPLYTIALLQPSKGGSIGVNKTKAKANTPIIVTVNPNDGYELETLSYSDGGQAVTINGTSFTMPAANITLTAKFKKTAVTPPPVDPDPEPEPVYYTVTLPAVEGATTDPAAGKYSVKKYGSFHFYLRLASDYDQSHPVVTTDRGETINPRTSDGAYIINDIREPLLISIDGVVKNTVVGNETIAMPDWLSIVDGRLCITLSHPETVRIYTFTGLLYRQLDLPAGETMIHLSPDRYIICIGKQSQKVIVSR